MPGASTIDYPKRVKNPNAVALGKLGGSRGGRARAASLSPEDRIRIARLAARMRWGEPAPTTLYTCRVCGGPRDQASGSMCSKCYHFRAELRRQQKREWDSQRPARKLSRVRSKPITIKPMQILAGIKTL